MIQNQLIQENNDDKTTVEPSKLATIGMTLKENLHF